MKAAIFLISVTVASTAANEVNPEGCQFCVEGLTAMFTDATAPDLVLEQIETLQNNVCPTYEDPSYCHDYLEEAWPIVATLLWTKRNAEFVCHTIDQTCPIEKVWDCDTCVQDIIAMNNAMKSEAVSAEFIRLLSGTDSMNNPMYVIVFFKVIN